MPVVRQLPNKPLVEAIFEFRWQIPSEEGDPHYTLFVGRLYDRVQPHYPFHEPLPTALNSSSGSRKCHSTSFPCANGWLAFNPSWSRDRDNQ